MGRIQYIWVRQDFDFYREYAFTTLGLGCNDRLWFPDYFESGVGLSCGGIIDQGGRV